MTSRMEPEITSSELPVVLGVDPDRSAIPRFFYLVRPQGEQWEVTFGGTGDQFVYDSRSEALHIAKGAARLHWEARNELSGVRAEDAEGHVRLIARYGP